MKHRQLIERMVTELYEPWMDDSDKKYLSSELLRQFGTELDGEIEIGIANGYTIEQLEALARSIFRGAKK